MSHYRLLATDMDDTLLNRAHEISPENEAAIHQAFEAGKRIIFCSGRCAAELRPYIDQFPEMRFAVTESGACVYDFREERGLNRHSFEKGIAKEILDYACQRDILVQAVIYDQGTIPADSLTKLGYYHLSQYQDFFETLARHVEDVHAYSQAQDWCMDKICLYHPSVEERDRTAADLAHLSVTMAFAEETGIEISPLGIDKGVGLSYLSRFLGIPMEDVIMVGDSFNDAGALAKAGLPVLVENAREQLKAQYSTIVASNQNSGVAEAIRRFLLAD